MLSKMLMQTQFDSAGLSGLASLAHPIQRVGHCRLEAHGLRGIRTRTVNFIVREGGKARVAVDLARLAEPDETPTEQVLMPNGMLNLSANSEQERCFVLLYHGHGSDPVWDSRVLELGDHYACLPIRPGRYLISNGLTNTRASVQVNYPDPRVIARGERLASEPVHLNVEQRITPGELRIDPGQLLVFAILIKAHVTIMLEEPDDGPADLPEWRAARSREALEAVFGRRR